MATTKRAASFVNLLREAHGAGLTDQALKESLAHWWRANCAVRFDGDQQSELMSFGQLAEAVRALVPVSNRAACVRQFPEVRA